MARSLNCLRNGAPCGYLVAPAPNANNPSATLSGDPMILPYISVSTTTTSSFNVLPSQQFVEPFLVSNGPGMAMAPRHSNMPQPSFSKILPATRADPFNTLPLELSHESNMLLNHCESKLVNPPFFKHR
jgi:hypothetical protein